jgi:hypothetical protein
MAAMIWGLCWIATSINRYRQIPQGANCETGHVEGRFFVLNNRATHIRSVKGWPC